MRKNRIRNIIIHTADFANPHALADRVSEFHAGVIERRLAKTYLTMEQKLTLIDKIIAELKSRETRNIIK